MSDTRRAVALLIAALGLGAASGFGVIRGLTATGPARGDSSMDRSSIRSAGSMP